MSRELTALPEALRLEQLEKGSLTVAGEIMSLILNICPESHSDHGPNCPCYEAGLEDAVCDEEHF